MGGHCTAVASDVSCRLTLGSAELALSYDARMFEERSFKDRLFIPVLVIVVFGSMLALRECVNRSQAGKPAREVLYLEAVDQVYECDRDGKRVLTDHPCQTGVPVKVLKGGERTDPAR